MIKRTLHFGNPAYLSTKNEQMEIKLIKDNPLSAVTVPIEDIGVIILEDQQITITHALMAKLLDNNVALVTCNQQKLPTGLLLNLDGHTKQTKIFQHQIQASEPLKKQLWQQVVAAKIANQGQVLNSIGVEDNYLQALSKKVKSGDADNAEAQAAQYFWKHYFQAIPFVDNKAEGRQRFGKFPNNLLNYGYAILRAVVARSLVGSGLLPTLGIFHRNQYNTYCLADDVMEAYRPVVDKLVFSICQNLDSPTEDLTPAIKKELLQIPTIDVKMDKQTRPLMVAVQYTTASLAKCFEGTAKKITLPQIATT